MELERRTPACVFVTGGAGFIGSAFLNLFVTTNPHVRFVNIDKLTYASNLHNLAGLSESPNYFFERIDITDGPAVEDAFAKHQPDWIFHFAAETHVDRSIKDPSAFINTNILGTYTLLEAARRHWGNAENKLFHHVSTDEVYGSLGAEGKFHETTAYDPSSPYSASKASSDHLVRAYQRTYSLPTVITNCSNNYGPRQFPEKLIPLMILNALEDKPLPVYGKGENVRDWLFVDDHCQAIWQVAHRAAMGTTYNIGGDSERSNIEVVRAICASVASIRGLDSLEHLIHFVDDRPGHDLRYAIDASRLKSEIGWSPSLDFEQGLAETISWYSTNRDWVESVKTGAYREWIETNYTARGQV